jgi:hypothetical protein
MGLVFLIIEFMLIHQYNLWNANWGGISVVLAAPVLTLPGLGIFWYLGLFRPTSPTPKWFLNVVFFYTILTLFAGSWLMEPRQAVSTQPAYYDTRTSYYQSRAYSYYGDVFGNLLDSLWGPDPAVAPAVPVASSDSDDDSSSSSSDSDSDSDVWIYIIAFAVLVIYLVGAFIVPGFWIVSSMLGCVTMLLLAWKEYQYGSDATMPIAEALYKALKRRGRV